MTLKEMLGLILLTLFLQLTLATVLVLLTPGGSLEVSSLLLAVGIMVTVAGSMATVLAFLFRKYAKERTMKVAIMGLGEDERRVFEEILRCKEIRQDDLRRRMDLSKAKLSALVNNLEKKGMILKLRYHKTNLLRPTKEFS
ncbi:MAG: helix-turn-helix domain-containing protein [Candidatus Hadarchaeales archaeon]